MPTGQGTLGSRSQELGSPMAEKLPYTVAYLTELLFDKAQH